MWRIEIVVKGCIAENWSEWFMGLAIQYTDQGQTSLCGEVIDQGAIYGLLNRLRDLGLPLLAVRCSEIQRSEA